MTEERQVNLSPAIGASYKQDTAKHFMVDIETLSTAVNAVVLSVGAVEFDPITGEIKRKFYYELDLSEQKQRHISTSTVQWWFKQCVENPKNVDLILKENKWKNGVEFVLIKLGAFISGEEQEEEYEKIAVWACDPDFDLAILSNLYEEHNLPVPWKYSEPKSVRTVRTLTQVAGIKITTEEANHNALDDCIRQAKEVTALLSTLHRLGKHRQNLINAYNGLVACRRSNDETHLFSNIDNVLYQIGKTFSLPVEVEL